MNQPNTMPDSTMTSMAGSQGPDEYLSLLKSFRTRRLFRRKHRGAKDGAFGLGPTDRAASRAKRQAMASASVAAQVCETPSIPETT